MGPSRTTLSEQNPTNSSYIYIYIGLHKEQRTILTSVGICPQASERPKMISKHDWNEWYCKQNKSAIQEQMHLHNIPATPHCGGWVLHEAHNYPHSI
jgi:hypothetical protein